MPVPRRALGRVFRFQLRVGARVALAAAQVTLPIRRRAASVPPALAAGLLAGLGSWPALAAAVPLLAVADLTAGPLRSPRTARRRGTWGREPASYRLPAPHPLPPGPSPAVARPGAPGPPGPPEPAHPGPPTMPERPGLPGPRAASEPPAAAAPSGRHAPVLLPARIAWRALRWRPVRAYAVALLPWLAALLFAANNQLVPLHATRAALLGGGGSCVLLLASLAGTLAARRPAWPWIRSLPWPARRRVLDDALLLGASCLPLLALTGLAAAAAVPPLAAILPWLAVRAAGAIRWPASPVSPAAGRLGPSGEILMEGALLAGLAALLPWSALLPLAAVPVAVRAAAARERRLKVGCVTCAASRRAVPRRPWPRSV